MVRNKTGAGRKLPVVVGLTFLVLGCLASVGAAFATNGVDTPPVNGVTADMVRASARPGDVVHDDSLDVAVVPRR